MKLKICTLLLSLMALTSCAQMNSDFDCPMKNGVRCQSLDQVNDAVDKGEIGGSRRFTEYQSSYIKSSWTNYSSKKSAYGSPIRNPDDVMRVWIAPYEDTRGNYHQASNVFTVARPSYWIGNPPKEIRGE